MWGRIILILTTLLILASGSTVAAKGTGNKKFLSASRITKKTLDQMDLDGIDKVMIVAHPDDEMIWGGIHLIKDHYLVVCLTNANTRKYGKTRARELKKVLAETQDTGIILNYPDYNNQHKVDHWTRYSRKIKSDLMTLLTYKDWKEVVTHNEEGEYGHIHHKKTHKFVTECFQKAGLTDAKLEFFGKYHYNRNYKGKSQYSKKEIKRKEQILKLYKSQKRNVKKLSHMNAYENWTVYGG